MSLRYLVAVALLVDFLACSGAGATAANVPPPIVGLVEGKDYERVTGGVPLTTQKGQVEVAEFFNYACPACNAFNPLLQSWMKGLPPTVRVVYVPMDFRADFVQYAHAFYAAEALGVLGKSHEAVYAAIHQTHDLPGEGRPQEAAVIAKFYTRYGVSAKDFQSAMDSFAVNMKTTSARQFALRSHVDSTPTLVVDGRYRIMGSSWKDMLQHASAVVTQLSKQ